MSEEGAHDSLDLVLLIVVPVHCSVYGKGCRSLNATVTECHCVLSVCYPLYALLSLIMQQSLLLAAAASPLRHPHLCCVTLRSCEPAVPD